MWLFFSFFFIFSLILYFWTSNLYFRFLVFAFWYLLSICTFKNPIFSTHFYLRARLLAWLPSPPLNSPFSPPGCLCLLLPPSLLYPTLWISVCSRRWRTLRELFTGWICLSPFHSPLSYSCPHLSPSSLSSSLYNSMNISEWSRQWSTHKGLLVSLLSPLLIPPHLIPVTSNSPLPLLFLM